MIWNDGLLFIDVPDSGGEVVAELLQQRLAGSVHATSPRPHDENGRGRFHQGRRHATLVDAESILAYLGRSLDDFDVVLTVMRNPYDREVAQFRRECTEAAAEPGRSSNVATSSETFVESLRTAPDPSASPTQWYFKLGGQMLPSLRVARFESLASDVLRHAWPFLRKGGLAEPPSNPPDEEQPWWTYYDDEAERLCYERNRWVFDTGFFGRRFDFGAAADSTLAAIGLADDRPSSGSRRVSTA